MTALKLSDLGIEIDQETLLERAAEIIANQALGRYTDDDGHWSGDSETGTLFAKTLEDTVNAHIDTAIKEIAGRNVLPHIDKFIEDYCLQETNKWGEAKGEKVTFTEYLVQCAHAYMEEPVDYQGEPRSSERSYNWSQKSTRLTFLIEKHLHYEIERAMKDALANSLGSICRALVETTRASLAEAAKKLQVEIKAR